MIIKSMITSAVIGIALPMLAVGFVSGLALAKAEPKKLSCKKCCLVCNGRCKTYNDCSSDGHERDLRS
jgi:hypothetical protein